MDQKIVKSQKELDAIPVDFNGRIIIQCGFLGRTLAEKREREGFAHA